MIGFTELPDNPRHGGYGHVCHEACEVWAQGQDCGCHVCREHHVSFLCPLHAAAPEMLELLNQFVEAPTGGTFANARALLAKIDGKE